MKTYILTFPCCHQTVFLRRFCHTCNSCTGQVCYLTHLLLHVWIGQSPRFHLQWEIWLVRGNRRRPFPFCKSLCWHQARFWNHKSQSLQKFLILYNKIHFKIQNLWNIMFISKYITFFKLFSFLIDSSNFESHIYIFHLHVF